MNLNKLTIEFYNKATLTDRKANGQYMTSSDIVSKSLTIEVDKNKPVLEPSCGTGQFIDCLVAQGYTNITAVEKDTKLYDMVKLIDNINFINADYLTTKFNSKFGLIAGNPPYFEISNSLVDKQFSEVISGRPNIYTLFLKKGIDELEDKGVLVFVIPTSLLSSKYFEKMRLYIIKYCNIERIEKLNSDNFDNALQNTMIFQIKKRNINKENNKKFIVKIGSTIIFSPEYKSINKYLIGKTFIKDMGCSVKTGNIVWNQFRDKYDLFTNTSEGNIPLIYPRNITSGKLILDCDNEKKFQYIKPNNLNKTIKGPVIVINRIIGINSISLNPVLIEEGNYYFENHINIISGKLEQLKIILSSLKSQETTDFIKNIIGNTQLSKTELETMIPIDQV